MNFNENYTHVMDDGSTLRFSDLLENDSRIIVDKYVNSMAGHIAAAEHMGIYSLLILQSRSEKLRNYT